MKTIINFLKKIFLNFNSSVLLFMIPIIVLVVLFTLHSNVKKPPLSQYVPVTISSPINNDIVIGNPKSPVEITMISYVTCYACQQWFNKEFPTIKKDLIDTNKAYIILREIPYTTSDIMATTYLGCLPDKDKLPNLLKLQTNSDLWSLANNDSSFLVKDEMKVLDNVQSTLNIKFSNEKDYNRFNGCLKNTDNILNYLDNDKKTVLQYGIKNFPVFFLGGQRYDEYLESKQIENTVFQVEQLEKSSKK